MSPWVNRTGWGGGGGVYEARLLGLAAFDLLTSTKLPHIQSGGPDGVVDITPD